MEPLVCFPAPCLPPHPSFMFLLFHLQKSFVLRAIPILHHLLPEHLRNPNRPLPCGLSIAKKIPHQMICEEAPILHENFCASQQFFCCLMVQLLIIFIRVNNCRVSLKSNFQDAGSISGAATDDRCVIRAVGKAGESECASYCVDGSCCVCVSGS
ncbi:hypothetical protein M9H77_21550 [Catharanthus roseus]|uniref:Uncharacterized protein n=1 Tax=Catharanthus roseus TaxID=4058 RepID=A0ACC0AP46_CATRO|nr:hypothetical protein M9H77_21550 [Catharanthus roseus]